MYSVLSASAKRIIVAAGTTAETKLLQLGSLDIKGKLLLFDLGYFSYPAFRDIVRQKGYFISRMKSNANPVIIADHHQGPGRRRALVGLKLKQAFKRRCNHDNWRLPNKRLKRWGLLSLQQCSPRLRLTYVRAVDPGERVYAP